MTNTRTVQRHIQLIRLLSETDSLAVADLAHKLNVSVWTLRRDLTILETQGVVMRFYGGARLAVNAHEHPLIQERVAQQDEVQVNEGLRRIGRATAQRLALHQHIGLGGGRTTLAVAQALKEQRYRGTIVTNALDIASTLADEERITVISSGGEVQPFYRTLAGPVTERVLRDYYYDTAIIGVSGISLERGLTVDSPLEAIALQTMISNSDRVWVVADEAKFDRTAFASLLPLDAIRCLITDTTPAPPFIQYLEERHIDLIVAMR